MKTLINCLRRCILTTLLLVIAFVLVFQSSAQAASDAPFRISAVRLDATGNTLFIVGDQALSSRSPYTALKLVAPYRLVIDLPDAELNTPITTIPIHQGGVRHVEMRQNRTTFYQAVQISILVEDYETLNRLSTSVEGSALRVHLLQAPETAPTPTAQGSDPAAALFQTWQPTAQTAGRNVIRDIFYRDGQLVIQADPNASGGLSIKNRLTLSAPSRLVLDLDNTALASKSLLGSIDVQGNPAIRQIRVGQFDAETVRLVIETPDPEQFNAFYPSVDKRTLAISNTDDVSAATLPAGTPMGSLESISLDQEQGKTVLRLNATAPVIHRVLRRNDLIQVEMLNIAARPGGVGYDRHNFPQIHRMNVENLAAGQPNSKFVIDMRDPSWEIETQLSADGQTLEIIMVPPLSATRIGLTKLPFAARVVVDAGHGGKDQGASRGGIREKDLNLRVAMKLKRALEARGVKVYMTRDSDEYLTLAQITQITNRIHPDVFVSVHHNASNNPGIRGIETYYYTPQSRAFADRVHRKMVNHVASPDRGVRKAMFYVIHHTSVPAILCEVGYVSNAQELREVAGDQRQDAEAAAIAEGVVEYLRSRVSASAR